MEAKIFFGTNKPIVLRRALRYAGQEGYVASMPELIHARTASDFDNVLWNAWYNSYSEECVVTSPRGNHVVITIHGGGIYSTPERFEKMYYASTDHRNELGFTGQFAAKISQREARDLLDGKMPDGAEIPIYDYEDFRQGIADLPNRYGVALDFELARQSESGYVHFDVLRDDPNMIIRAGGREAAARYLDKFQARNDTQRMGHWHPFNAIDPNQPQASMLSLAGNQGGRGSDVDEFDPTTRTQRQTGLHSETGLSSGGGLSTAITRYVAVAPHDAARDVRHLDFGL
jgi:hypothetical protein